MVDYHGNANKNLAKGRQCPHQSCQTNCAKCRQTGSVLTNCFVHVQWHRLANRQIKPTSDLKLHKNSIIEMNLAVSYLHNGDRFTACSQVDHPIAPRARPGNLRWDYSSALRLR